MKYNTIVIGAGVAGLMCAKNITDSLVLEKSNKAGCKLLITGNGRCNLTNLKDNNSFLNKITHNSKYLYSTIFNFGPKDIYSYFNKFVPLKEEEENQIFPMSDKAIDILNVLKDKVNINFNTEVLSIKKIDNNYEIITNKGIYVANNVVIATGGCSFSKTGSNGVHRILNDLKQPLVKYYPVEVGLITKNKYELAGTSFFNVVIKYKKHITTGKLIFTHKGISGTSAMAMSEYLDYSFNEISIDFLPNISKSELYQELEKSRDLYVHQILNKYFSKKFSEYLVNNKLIKQIDHKELLNLINRIKEGKYFVKTDKLDNAYVTGGGVDLKYIDTRTFESKIYKGLYFIGECLDIHGPIGGYNITLALSTAMSVANNIK